MSLKIWWMLLIAIEKLPSSVKIFLEAKCWGFFLMTQINVLVACGFIERFGDGKSCKCFYLSDLCLSLSLFPKKPGVCGAASCGQRIWLSWLFPLAVFDLVARFQKRKHPKRERGGKCIPPKHGQGAARPWALQEQGSMFSSSLLSAGPALRRVCWGNPAPLFPLLTEQLLIYLFPFDLLKEICPLGFRSFVCFVLLLLCKRKPKCQGKVESLLRM